MKLSQLNEAASFSFEDGITVYLDKTHKTFRFATDKESEKAGNKTHTITSKREYEKLAKKYKIDISMQDWVEVSKQAKKKKADNKFKKALDSMMSDIENMDED